MILKDLILSKKVIVVIVKCNNFYVYPTRKKYSDQENQRVVKTVIQEMKSLESSTPQIQVGGKYIANVYRKNGLWSMGGWGGGVLRKCKKQVRKIWYIV